MIIKDDLMGKKALASILSFVILCLFLSIIFYWQISIPSQQQAHNGVINISNLNTPVRLDGEWKFYWQQLLAPSDLKQNHETSLATIPGVWNGNQLYSTDAKLPPDGYATYSLTFNIDQPSQQLSILLPHISTSYNIWINGKQLSSIGTVGTTTNSAFPQYATQELQFETQAGANNIVIQVANFTNLFGGINSSIYLGTPQQIQLLDRKNLTIDVLLIGSLIIMGIYHFTLFTSRKKDFSAFHFGLLCLIIGLRTAVTSQRYILTLFPDLPWELLTKIEYLTYYLGTITIIRFLYSLYPTKPMQKLIKFSLPIVLFFSLLVVFTDVKVYGKYSDFFDLYILAGSAIIFYSLWLARKKFFFYALIFTYGFIILLVTVINDLLQYKNILHTPLLLPFGLLTFMSCQAFILCLRFTNAFRLVEAMSISLKNKNKKLRQLYIEQKKSTEIISSWNQKLEETVSARTKALEEANNKLLELSFLDGLTKIANRRHFDEVLEKEWFRSCRSQLPLSVIIFDIDFFKLYNDHYGHLSGDECLKKVAKTASACIKRSCDLAARYGGEEFVFLLPNTNLDGAIKVAERLRQGIENLNIEHVKSPKNKITCSVGVATLIADKALLPTEILALADKNLYKAKDSGRNTIYYSV